MDASPATHARPSRARPSRAHLSCAHLSCARPVSPLMMADRLITLAQDADHAGFHDTASHLVSLVYTVLDRQAAL